MVLIPAEKQGATHHHLLLHHHPAAVVRPEKEKGRLIPAFFYI